MDKADRADVLSAVSSLQAGLGQKADRADAEAALARKLDVRTFLASQSSVPALDTVSLGGGGTAATSPPLQLARSRSALRPTGSGPLTPAASLVRAHSLAATRSGADAAAANGDSPNRARSPGQLSGRWHAVDSAQRPPLPSSGSFAAGRLGGGVEAGAAGGVERERPSSAGVPLQSVQAVQQWRERTRAATPARLPSASLGLRTPTATPKGAQVWLSSLRTMLTRPCRSHRLVYADACADV